MTKGLRLSERWFQRGLWLIAVVFAGFLIGLGSLVVGDLPHVEKPVDAESFMDQSKLVPVRQQRLADDVQLKQNEDESSAANLELQHATEATQAEQASFDNWVATRTATQQASQNAELVQRTQRLDAVKQSERRQQQAVDLLESQGLQLRRVREGHAAAERGIMDAGREGYERALRRTELRVFLLRLALTLPLLLVAGLLFVKARRSAQWPFVWGFIIFALFTFFVELVPYLPSYGGYVRYIVGIVLTVLVGNYAIGALRRYLERQKMEEQKPEEERRKELSYETAQARLGKQVCPGCERRIDVADASNNFCMHCGLLLFESCTQCATRQTVFTHFCRMCGLVKAERISL